MNKPNKLQVGRAPLELVGLVLLAGVFVLLAVISTANRGGNNEGTIALPPAVVEPTQSIDQPLADPDKRSTVKVAGTRVEVGTSTGGGSGTAETGGDELIATGPDGQPLPKNPALEPGDAVTLRFGGFAPQASVGVVLRSTPRNLGSILSDNDGAVTYSFTVPADLEPGRHTVTFTGNATDLATASSSRISAATVSNGVNTVVFEFTNSVDVIDLTLSSTVSGPLLPGVSRTLLVTVNNPNPYPANLYRVDVEVGTPDVAGCQANWVSAGNYLYSSGPQQVIPANSSISVELPIELLNLSSTDQSACRGATFPLTLFGQGVGD